jgi:hypothetical protein
VIYLMHCKNIYKCTMYPHPGHKNVIRKKKGKNAKLKKNYYRHAKKITRGHNLAVHFCYETIQCVKSVHWRAVHVISPLTIRCWYVLNILNWYGMSPLCELDNGELTVSVTVREAIFW